MIRQKPQISNLSILSIRKLYCCVVNNVLQLEPSRRRRVLADPAAEILHRRATTDELSARRRDQLNCKACVKISKYMNLITTVLQSIITKG
jgi:hypothetical protein